MSEKAFTWLLMAATVGITFFSASLTPAPAPPPPPPITDSDFIEDMELLATHE